MRDECRPFPSNGNARTGERRGCVPPPSRSDGNPRRKKRERGKEKCFWKKEEDGEVKKSRENTTNFRVTRHKERLESDTNFQDASRAKLSLDVQRPSAETKCILPKIHLKRSYCSSNIVGARRNAIAAGINFNNCSLRCNKIESWRIRGDYHAHASRREIQSRIKAKVQRAGK